jgi:pilus assembly protein Flp/PilA
MRRGDPQGKERMSMVGTLRLTAAWLISRLNIKSERGATAVEYGVMVALIAAVIIIAVVFLGQKTSSTFNCTGSAIESKVGGC